MRKNVWYANNFGVLIQAIIFQTLSSYFERVLLLTKIFIYAEE